MSGPQDSITLETVSYLIPLLDPQKDKAEIAVLHDRVRRIGQLPRFITPIVIPLREHAGIPDLVDRNARVQFDADGSGIRKEWSWITPDAGWLVHAPEKSRPITSALQVFGVTFCLFWENGYQALDALDDNRDGPLSGVELEDLGIWQDANMNGISESGEVKPVAEWGIVSIACEHQSTPGQYRTCRVCIQGSDVR